MIDINKNALFIIEALEKNGFEAYAVGGCIRDCIMDIKPHDWDITTSALPFQTKKIFKHTVDTGIEHGTITVIINKEGFEVTTFRTGSKNDNIENYTDKLACDLNHRDFTINAIACNPSKGIIDLWGGIDDIKNKTIRAVENPVERFKEDPLRMLRAIRFSAVLDFKIHKDTLSAIFSLNDLIKNVSIERIRDEFFKLIGSQCCQNILLVYQTGLYRHFMPCLKDILNSVDTDKFFNIMNSLENIPFLRLAWLFKAIGSKSAEKLLKELRTDNKTAAHTAKIIKYLDYNVTDSYTAGKLMSMTDLYKYVLILQKKYLLYYEKSVNSIELAENLCNNIINNCHKISDLDINGNDLIKMGIQGKSVGIVLNSLLDVVLHYPEKNKKEILTEYAKEMLK